MANKQKLILAVFFSLICTTYAIDTWKNDINASFDLKNNLSLKTQIETQEELSSDNQIEYFHIQQLITYKTGLLDISPGVRLVDKNNNTITVPMIELSKGNNINNKLSLKHRLRYMYEIIEEKEDKQILRYRLNPVYKLNDSLSLSSAVEFFSDETFDHYRTRYWSKIIYKLSKFNISIGYEYNDNTEKQNIETLITDISFKF